MEMHEDSYLANVIDFILWKDWDPIGGGQLNLPRDEYSMYVNRIVRALNKNASENDIANILEDIVINRMGMKSNLDLSIRIGTEIINIPKNEKLKPRELKYFLEIQEVNLNDVFIKYGFPTVYYFYDLIETTSNFNKILKEKILPLETYQGHWNDLRLLGLPWINLCPVGFWEQAFVYCVEYKLENINKVPIGLTSILTPGLPMDIHGNLKTRIEENVEIVVPNGA